MRTIGACAVACDPALVNKKAPTYSRGYLQALRNRVKASSSPFAVPSTECSRGGGERAVRSPSSRPPSCASTRGRSSCPLHSRSNAAMRTSYAWSKDKGVHPWDTPLECEGLVCDVGDLLPIPPGYDGSGVHGSQAAARGASPRDGGKWAPSHFSEKTPGRSCGVKLAPQPGAGPASGKHNLFD